MFEAKSVIMTGGSMESSETSLRDLGLSNRLVNAFDRVGVRTLGDVLQMSPIDVLSIKNIGFISYLALKAKLEQLDVLPKSWLAYDDSSEDRIWMSARLLKR